MKQETLFRYWHSITVLFVVQLLATSIWAQQVQDGGTTATPTTPGPATTVTQEEWYAEPWVWILGGIIVIAILVMVLRRREPADQSRR